jgi:hypothetical protein
VDPLVFGEVPGGDEGVGAGPGFEAELESGVGAAGDGAHHEVVALFADAGGFGDEAAVPGSAIGEVGGLEPGGDRHCFAGHVEAAEIDVVIDTVEVEGNIVGPGHPVDQGAVMTIPRHVSRRGPNPSPNGQ